MSLSLQITIFDNEKFSIKGTYISLSYNIAMDAISNVSSSFTVDAKANVDKGDYIGVKTNDSANLIYYGQITSIDSNGDTNIISLNTNYIWNLLNGDIIVGNKDGSSYEKHILKLIDNYVDNDKNSFINKYITNSTNTEFQVTSSGGISTNNFLDYLIRGFKLHNTIFDVTGIQEDFVNGIPVYYPKIDYHQITDVWNFKNNVYDFNNWNVTDSRNLRGYNNELWIVDQASTDMENMNILKRYWLTKDGKVIENFSDDVMKPTQVQIYLFDQTATDKPTYESVAKSNLSANTYSHNIQFDAQLDNNFIPIQKIKLGLQSNIYYNNNTYKSILTSYSFSSDSEVINLVFGNLRFGRNDLFGTTN